MDSGRAAPRVESAAPSAPSSPVFGPVKSSSGGVGGAPISLKGLKPLTSNVTPGTGTPTIAGAGAGAGTGGGAGTPSGTGGAAGAPAKGENANTNQNANISADGRRRIWAAMNGFRPKFRQIARTLTEVDLVFIEEAMERWMLQYDRAFACTFTKSLLTAAARI